VDCERDFETTLIRQAEFTVLFAGHRSFSISYEQLISGERSQLDKLLRFLGVSTRELTTTTRRLGRDNLRSVIANYDELREYFCESRFAEFFEDSIKRE